MWRSGLTTELSHPGPKDVDRDSGTESVNPGWLQRLVSQVSLNTSRHNFERLRRSVAHRLQSRNSMQDQQSVRNQKFPDLIGPVVAECLSANHQTLRLEG